LTSFIPQAALKLLTSRTALNLNQRDTNTEQMTKKVVIVGGGIAGIKAALELDAQGIEYQILEAKDRLGGRLHTVQGKNTKYDLGASWYHETLNNALFDEEVSDKTDELKWFFDDAPLKVIAEDGEVHGSLKLEPIGHEIYKFAELESYKDLEKDESLYDVIIRYLKTRKHLLSDEQILKASQYARRLELWHGIEIKTLSSKDAMIDNAGRDALALHYDKVLKRHTDRLDMAKVSLKTVVTCVQRVDNCKKIIITTKSGEKHQADYAIIAVPQSILQLEEGNEGHIEFEPRLPKRIIDGLQRVHFGALGKVVLEFDKVFWPTDSERIYVMSTPPSGFLEAIRNDTEVPEHDSSAPTTWDYPLLFLNLAMSFKIPSFVVLTQSPLTDYLEANPSVVWKYLKPIVCKLAGTEDVPDPSNQIVTQWTQDPYQRGSYSACYPGDDPLEPILALENGFGNVRFAGEHTILEGAGCVHGAWSSGIREAKYIIDN
jgi:polyamine oxidase